MIKRSCRRLAPRSVGSGAQEAPTDCTNKK